MLTRIDELIDRPLSQALKKRERRAARILDVDDGLTSPYLEAFVMARINPIRFSKATSFDFDEVVEKMRSTAGKFNVERIRQEDVAKMGARPLMMNDDE